MSFSPENRKYNDNSIIPYKKCSFCHKQLIQKKLIGVPDRIWTHDLQDTDWVLYPLSYTELGELSFIY